MKLYYAPGACSIGIHLLLEEIGKPYELQLVKIREGEQFKPEFTRITPKSKVPALARDDGSVLTEYPAIAYWLAATHPEANLLPEGADAMARALEATDYSVATAHMQGFSRIFRPVNFAPSEGDHDKVKARGEEIFGKALATLDAQLAGREWVAGRYSFADSAVFYVCYWAAARLKMTLPPNLAAHYARMKARPAVQRMLKQEGLEA